MAVADDAASFLEATGEGLCGMSPEIDKHKAMVVAVAAIDRLMGANKTMRATMEAHAAWIEDSQYFGGISPRGPTKMLVQIADEIRVTLDTVDSRRCSNTQAQTRSP